MPPKGKKAAAKNKSEAPPAKTTDGEKNIKKEKTPTVSPDQGATGETTTSFGNKKDEARYKEEYRNEVIKLRKLINFM